MILDRVAQNLLQRIPPVRGKTRLARLLLNYLLKDGYADVTTVQGIIYSVPSLKEPVAFHLFIDGLYETEVLHFILSKLPSGSVFVDVGANIGAHSLPVAHHMRYSNCRVISIEASPRIFPYLTKNCQQNKLDNISLRQVAAYEVDGTSLPFWEAPAAKFGMGALAPQFHSTPVDVPTMKLDTLLAEEGIDQVNIIKVDVEGAESSVFRGAKKILTNTKPPYIIFEFCDWAELRYTAGNVGDSQQVLREYGFTIWRLKDYVENKPPLSEILVEGSDTLVAAKVHAS